MARLEGLRLVVEPPPGFFEDDPLKTGESVAIDGVCLTVLPSSTITRLEFDLSFETVSRTGLGTRERVHLERAMRAGDRFGGHFVQGHVDGRAVVMENRPDGEGRVLVITADDGRFLVDKGSVTLDGVSLTVVRPQGDLFEVWLVPHTLSETTLAEREPGEAMNVEYDVIAKHVERLLAARTDPGSSAPH